MHILFSRSAENYANGAVMIRSPLVSGIFYPSDGNVLKQQIDDLLTRAIAHAGYCNAVMAPHGSLTYSGVMAAAAWKAMEGSMPSLVIVVGPSHSGFDEGIFLPESSQFAMPDFRVQVDMTLCEYLLRKISGLTRSDIPHLEEHSIEMQLPFLHAVFPGVPMLPVIVSGRLESYAELLSEIFSEIRSSVAGTVNIVISSNLAMAEDEEACDASSLSYLDAIMRRDYEAMQRMRAGSTSFCGSIVEEAFLRSFPELQAEVITYGNSAGRRTSPEELVVGYAAVRFRKA